MINTFDDSISHFRYRLLFNSALQNHDNTYLFPPLFYPSTWTVQSDSSFRFYHETLFRSLLDQFSQIPSINTTTALSSNIIPFIPSDQITTSFTSAENSRTTSSSSSSPTMKTKKNVITPKLTNLTDISPSSSNDISATNSRPRRRLVCSECTYTTNRLNNLKRHIQTMHEKLSDPIDCCDQLFTSKAHFRAHVNSEHRCGYHCDVCRRTFCRKALLRRHQSIHSGHKAFVCRICSYSTSHKGNLDRHTRVHRQNRKHIIENVD